MEKSDATFIMSQIWLAAGVVSEGAYALIACLLGIVYVLFWLYEERAVIKRAFSKSP